MASDFGLTLGIEGEKAFKQALTDINGQFKVLGSEMKLATSEFDTNEKSVESLTAKNEVLAKQIEAQKEKVETLRKALENASDSFGENDRRTQAWVVQLNNAQAGLNSMERELSQNEKAVDEMGNEMQNAANQTDSLEDELEDAGGQADASGGKFERLGSVVKGIGVAMGAAMAAIGTAAVAAGKALVDMTVSAAANADELITTSTVTGMSVENLQAYSYAADLVDVSLDTLTGAMAKNVKSMANAADGSAKYAEAYAQLGVAVTNADGTLRDSEEVYWACIDALGNISNETERDALAMQLFGKSAQDLNPLIAQGSAGIAALTEEAHQMGAVLSDESIAKLGAFDDSVQRLTQGSSAAKNVLGTILLPQLQTLADEGVALLGGFTSGMVAAGDDFGKISEVIGSTVGGIVDVVMEHLPSIIQVSMDMVGAIGGAIMDNLPTIVECATAIVLDLVDGMTDSLPKITEAALQLILTISKGILDNLPKIIESAVNVITTLANGLANALPTLIPSIVQAILLICATLLEHMDEILQAAFAIIKGLAQGLIEALPTLVQALPQLITAIVDFITNNLPELVALGIDLTVQLAAGLVQAIPQLLAALPQLISALVGGLGLAVDDVTQIGKNIVSGLWNGIQSMASWIGQQVSGFVSGIVDSAKSLLGIASPSKVFAGIGENMGLGIGEGFSGSMRDVERDMQNAIPTDFDLDLNGSVSGMPSQTAFQPLNVTIPLTLDGTTLTRVVSQIQWTQNAALVRSLGTA